MQLDAGLIFPSTEQLQDARSHAHHLQSHVELTIIDGEAQHC